MTRTRTRNLNHPPRLLTSHSHEHQNAMLPMSRQVLPRQVLVEIEVDAVDVKEDLLAVKMVCLRETTIELDEYLSKLL